jgi:hypothetical protein
MPKYWALGVAMAALFGGTFVARAQTIPAEYNKKIASHSELGTLTGDFAGDRIDLSSGSLEIVQTDIDLPGNNALPVRVARRFEPADSNFGAISDAGDWISPTSMARLQMWPWAAGGWTPRRPAVTAPTGAALSGGRPKDSRCAHRKAPRSGKPTITGTARSSICPGPGIRNS